MKEIYWNMFCKFRYRENLKKNESLFEKFKENEILQKISAG